MARKEVKTIKNSKSVRVYTLVTALLLTLLLSLLIGIVVAPKPDSPDKSVKTWDLKIWIGIEGDDVVLLTPVHDDGVYLVAEDVTCSGDLWDIPKKKGKGRIGPNNYLSAQVDLFGWEEDDWCTWELADVEGYNSEGQPVSLGVFDLESLDTAYVSIRHAVMPSGADYWTFVIEWIVEFDLPTTYEFYQFRAGTDRDENIEGTLSDEGWLVPFNGADAMLFSDWTDEDLDGVPDNFDWMGTVSFMVKITREPHVA